MSTKQTLVFVSTVSMRSNTTNCFAGRPLCGGCFESEVQDGKEACEGCLNSGLYKEEENERRTTNMSS